MLINQYNCHVQHEPFHYHQEHGAMKANESTMVIAMDRFVFCFGIEKKIDVANSKKNPID